MFLLVPSRVEVSKMDTDSASRFEGQACFDNPQLADVYSTRGKLTQARSASDGTVPSLALRACVKPARGQYNLERSEGLRREGS